MMAEAIKVQTLEEMQDDASRLADDLLGRIAIVFGRSTVDARMVVCACAQIAGSYAFGIGDEALKRDLVEHWIATFREFSGVEPVTTCQQPEETR